MLHQLMASNFRTFDRTYIDQQVTAHQNALQLMNGFAQAGGPRPLRQAAAKTAPLVQHHLDLARQLQARMR
jgi:putative membrane protein